MTALLLTAVGLGLAGIDPAGALIAVAALAAGARDRTVLAYGVVVLVGTAAFGTLLSLVAGRRLEDVDWAGLVPQGRVGAVIEVGAGVGLLVWAGLRLRRPDVTAPRPGRRRSGAGLLVTGVVFAASAVLDPTFVGLVVIAGRGEPWWQVAIAHLLWVLISQLPLALLVVAIALRAHGRMVARFERWWERARPVARRLLTGALVLAGAFLLVDGAWFFATGEFLVPGP